MQQVLNVEVQIVFTFGSIPSSVIVQSLLGGELMSVALSLADLLSQDLF